VKTRTIRKRMIILFGSLLLIAFFVVFIFSRIALQLYMTNQLKDDFEEEISIITSVFKEEFAANRDEVASSSIIENFRSGKRRVGYFNLDSQIEIIAMNNGNIRLLTSNEILGSSESEMIKKTILNESFNNILTLNRVIKGEEIELKYYISPLSLNKSQESRFFAIMTISVRDEVIELQRFSRILFLILFFVYLVTMIWVFIIASKLTKPIKEMKIFVKSLGSGEEPNAISVNTSDELQDLGQALNTMAKDIKNANEEQLRFLQNASHELKTPLTSIQGYAEGLMDGVIIDNKKALDIIIEESIRLKKIVNQLSLLSKLETGVKTYKHEEIDLLVCIKDVVNRMSIQSMNKIDIVIGCDGNQSYKVNGDYDAFIQIFLNVLSNGLRYAHHEIEIKLIKLDVYVEVSFIDDGLGIKENAISHLFERFYKGNKGDTGLGLAIVKAITEQQKGKIDVYNSSDKGAVFRFVFPIN